MATLRVRVDDELLAEIEARSTRGVVADEPYTGEACEIAGMAAELLRVRREGHAPEGRVLVGEATVRAWCMQTGDLVGLHCLGSLCPVGYPQCGATSGDDDRDGLICTAALLAHFNIAPEPEPAQEEDHATT
jgi:hypothetical protein